MKPKKRVTRIPVGVELPEKFKRLEPNQRAAIDEIVAHLESGVKVVFLDAPTGSGKTVIAETVRQVMEATSVYMCSSLTLQDQFVGDFDYARVVKGRANYAPDGVPMGRTCADCTQMKPDDPCLVCKDVRECPYRVARDLAGKSALAVLNTTYFLHATTNPKSPFVGRDLGIIDEVDMLEGELMRFVEVRMGPRLLGHLRLAPPGKGVHGKTIQAWIKNEALPVLRRHLKTLDQKDKAPVAQLIRNLNRIDMANDDHWVREYDGRGSFILKPYKVHEFAEDNVWKKADQWLCMSATIISPDDMANSLGLEDGEWELVSMGSRFPVENRPVVFSPVADMTKKNYDESLPHLAKSIRTVLRQHPDENVLVHTVSYKLANDLAKRLVGAPHRIRTYTDSKGRDAAAATLFQGTPTCLIAPSLDRGVDFHGDSCTVQVVAKIPYPYLGDPMVSKRMNDPDGGRLWYQAQTARTLIQSTGRAVRTPTDVAVTYIFDKQFGSWLAKGGRKLLPSWWYEAVETHPPQTYR